MEIKLNEMCKWEKEKALFLMQEALKLGMDLDGYGEIAVNPNSGYTYLWLEDHDFTLYMPINCDLVKGDIWALWTSPEDGREEEYQLDDDTDLKMLEDWASEQIA